MSAHEFLFPPPPPPPPLATSNYTPSVQNPSFGGRGNRGNRGSRGRGQSGDRRGFRAGQNGSLGNSIYQRNDSHISNSSGHPTLGSNQGSGYPLPNYPPIQQPQYSQTTQDGYGHQSSNYPPSAVVPAPGGAYYSAPLRPQYHDGNAHIAAYSHDSPNYNASYPPHEPYNYDARPSRANNPAQPLPAGPPIRMGFDSNQQRGYPQATFQPQIYPQQYPSGPNAYSHKVRIDTRSPLQQSPSINFRSGRRGSPNHFLSNRSRGQKRGHQDAFGEARQSTLKANSKSQVSPAVPSFGIPLPVKPPIPETIRKPRKKKRRHNQLGLTPKNLEHESSEEDENDIDEEAKLAAAASLPSSELQQLKFTYKGQTSVLQSSSEVELWIAERKKRFPTKARQEEKRKQLREMHETHRAAKQDREATAKLNAEAKEKQKADAKVDAKVRRKEDAKAKRKEQARETHGVEFNQRQRVQAVLEEKEAATASDSAATKAKLKMEKLRKMLEKEERRVARAEAKVAKLKAEANNYADVVEQSSLPKVDDTKRSESFEIDKGLKDDPHVHIKVETENAIRLDEAGFLKNETSDMVHSEMMDVVKEDIDRVDSEDNTLEVSIKMPDPLTPTSQPSQLGQPEHGSERDPSPLKTEPVTQITNISLPIEHNLHGLDNPVGLETENSPISSGDSISSSSSSSISMLTDSEETSSDDSSSSASSSAPESCPSKRIQPDRVAPAKRPKTKTICRNFLQTGRCRKGRVCRFRHELPERGNLAEIQRKQRKQARREGKEQRVGLYQRLVEQEKQKEQEEEAKSQEQQKQQLLAESIQKEDAAQVPGLAINNI